MKKGGYFQYLNIYALKHKIFQALVRQHNYKHRQGSNLNHKKVYLQWEASVSNINQVPWRFSLLMYVEFILFCNDACIFVDTL